MKLIKAQPQMYHHSLDTRSLGHAVFSFLVLENPSFGEWKRAAAPGFSFSQAHTQTRNNGSTH